MSSEGAPQKTENVEDWQSGMTTTEVAAAPIQQAGQTKHGQRLQKQRQLGPAPIASFEDISDEVRQKMDSSSTESRLPEIREQVEGHGQPDSMTSSIQKQMTLDVNPQATPRIDISRASSSSQHEDSRDSSPENVFEQIGTGTLQESAMELGFREDGTLDLRSSTEELYFMEPEKQPLQQAQPQCRSPVTVKIDDLPQNQRKDSVSSEVAALLCISGRTSRISSVGSQGSAASRLSAISGISRSPSPHRMLLETSFCGPKPVDSVLDTGLISSVEPQTAEALEQMILARNHDPTQVILAEGINMPDPVSSSGSRPKRQPKDKPSSGSTSRTAKQAKAPPEVKITKPQSTISKTGAPKPIVGKTQSGAEYIRIKLKPDHLYEDNGLGENEKVLDIPLEEAIRKPATLNIRQGQAKAEEKKAEKTGSSPKPARHIFSLGKDSGSRSPSPATVVSSRKNSFCSLFKLKDNTAPDSPTALQARKKSSASARENDEAHSHRSRSCGKIKDSDKLTPSPSKQKSVLGLFKTKKTGTKSKSTSPIDHEDRHLDTSADINPFYSAHQQPNQGSKARLRYYDTPLDGKSIHIPLHTPPDEKDSKSTDDAIAMYNKMLDDQLHDTELGRSILRSLHKEVREPDSSTLPTKAEEPKPKSPKNEEPRPKPPQKNEQPKVKASKTYRIENPDGSIRIPLRTPSDEKDPATVCEVHVERVPEVVKAAEPPPRHVDQPKVTEMEKKPDKLLKNSKTEIAPLPPISVENVVGPSEIQPPETVVPPPTPASITIPSAREKKHILFTTKIGSGSEEQLFQTQLSLSKTESLCSPSSEPAGTLESPPHSVDLKERLHKEVIILKDTKIDRQSSSDEKNKPDPFFDKGKPSANVQMPIKAHKHKVHSTDRNSMLIENMEEIMDKQKKIHNLLQKEIDKKDSTSGEENLMFTPESTPVIMEKRKSVSPSKQISTDDHILSSESDKDSETTDTSRPKKHLPRNLAIDEHESTGLVSQISYEDELPYIPTTLPEERAVGVPLIPIKERANMEVKTYPLERPRSTTPLNPSFLEEYCCTEDNQPNQKIEKLKISLPRKDSREKIQKPKSPRRVSNTSNKTWFEFDQNLKEFDCRRNSEPKEDQPPPPLPPRGSAPVPPQITATSTQWINFENIPEKRKPPKRITTVPHKEPTPPPENAVYQYVKPDECQCECHEIERKASVTPISMGEDAEPLLEQENGDLQDGATSMRL